VALNFAPVRFDPVENFATPRGYTFFSAVQFLYFLGWTAVGRTSPKDPAAKLFEAPSGNNREKVNNAKKRFTMLFCHEIRVHLNHF
jgi:hypothetical protein